MALLSSFPLLPGTHVSPNDFTGPWLCHLNSATDNTLLLLSPPLPSFFSSVHCVPCFLSFLVRYFSLFLYLSMYLLFVSADSHCFLFVRSSSLFRSVNAHRAFSFFLLDRRQQVSLYFYGISPSTDCSFIPRILSRCPSLFIVAATA